MRKLATAAFSFSIAVFLSRYILPNEWQLISGAVAAALSLGGLLLHGRIRLRIAIALLSAAAGIFWSLTYSAVFIAPSIQLHGETASVTAVVTDYPSARAARGYRADATIRRDSGPDIGVRIYYYTETELKPGDLIEFTARFRRTEGTESDERIDALSARGAFLAAYVSGEIEVIGAEGGLRYLPKKLANSIAGMIETIFPGDISHFMQALLVGKRD